MMSDPNPSPADPGNANAQTVQPEPSTPMAVPQLHQTQLLQNHDLIQPPMPASISAFPVASVVVPPSYRPGPQFSHLSGYQPNPVTAAPIPPPGIVTQVLPGSVPAMQYHMPVPGQPPNPAMRHPFVPIANGFAPPPQGSVAPPGIARFPGPYPTMVRPIYPLRPPGVLPVVSRPPIPGTAGIRPMVPSLIRPAIPSVTPAEKPQTTVYVGKIATTVEDEFMHSLLLLCGQVKTWKRGRDPSGTPRGFGFCEFESAEGVLRCLRLLNRFNIDGQELLINVNQATKEYLERYIERKTENSRNLKESETGSNVKDEEGTSGDSKDIFDKSSSEEARNVTEKDDNDTHDLANFGIVTKEDKESDLQILDKLTIIIEERLKSRPLPPPPPPQSADGSRNQAMESIAKSRAADGTEEDAAEDKNDDESTSENRAVSDQERNDTLSPDISQKFERRSRERDPKREQEREAERYEREAERERVRKEREHRRKIEDAGRAYEERLKDWEYREREKEKQRQYEKDREKEKERKRCKEIQYDEEDEEDERKRWRRSVFEEKKRRRLQEKKEDLADRLKEEEEIVEARLRAEEEKTRGHIDESKYGNVINGNDQSLLAGEDDYDNKDNNMEHDYESVSGFEPHKGDAILRNGLSDSSVVPLVSELENRQFGALPAKKLGFGLVGSGKRTAVLSVFNEEDDDETHKEKKMRPLVPIDYSTEELQTLQTTEFGTQPSNLAAAAEYAKRISTARDEKHDSDRERNRRNHDRSSQRDRDGDHNYEDVGHSRDENRNKPFDRDREIDVEKVKTPEKQSFLDAKQLIDMIPKTKDELFSFEINWSVYDKHKLHERMRPWISKKITEFLGEEEATLVDYIVSGTQDHVQATQMLEMLQSILDDEAEMFVLKMWRMLIFEIKKVETGLTVRSKA